MNCFRNPSTITSASTQQDVPWAQSMHAGFVRPECRPSGDGGSPTPAFQMGHSEKSSSLFFLKTAGIPITETWLFPNWKTISSILLKPPLSQPSFGGVIIIYLPLFHSILFMFTFLVPFSCWANCRCLMNVGWVSKEIFIASFSTLKVSIYFLLKLGALAATSYCYG